MQLLETIIPNLRTHTRFFAVTGLLFAIQISALFALGQPWVCACGIAFWEGDVYSVGNSQQLTDWYTFSHIIHGFIFFFILRYLFPRTSVLQRLLMALMLEIGWEVLENSPLIIERYRAQALAVGYVGDSILNSVSDSVAMLVGYLLTYKLSARAVIVLLILFELYVGIMIHDNLILNIINLIYPSDTIHHWQSNNL